MSDNPEKINHSVETEHQGFQGSFFQRLEKEFDWNLIFVVSIWLFLFATSFLIFISA